MSSEATNQLDPSFPVNGKVDRKEYTDMRKLLEAATGGRYRWSTATRERARQNRALAVQDAQESQGGCLPQAPQQAPSSSLGTHIQHGGHERSARGLQKRGDQSGGQRVPAPSVFDQAIDEYQCVLHATGHGLQRLVGSC